MKIRKGFVSNSSSSSFILAMPKDKTEITLTKKVNLLDFKDEEFTDVEKAKEWFKENWCEEGEENETVKKTLDAIRNGKKVFIGQVSSDDCDNPMSQLFYNEGFTKEEINSEDVDIILEVHG